MKQKAYYIACEKSLADNDCTEHFPQEKIDSLQSLDFEVPRSGVRYLRTRILDNSKYAVGSEWSKALDNLYEQLEVELGRITPQRKRKFRRTLEVIVCNLIVAYEGDNSLFIVFNLGKKKGQKLPHEIKRDIVKALEGLGYIELKRGYSFKESRARRSRMRATQQLHEIVMSHGATHWQVTCPYEPLTLKGKRRRPIKFRTSSETQRIVENVVKLNEILWKAGPHLQLPPNIPFPSSKSKMGLRIPYDQSQNRLKRSFNRASFKSGGRFAGHWLQRIPSIYRQFIILAGSETVELDYGGLHFALMYGLKGIQMYNDPYFVPHFDQGEQRKLCKVIANTMVNAESEKDAHLGALSTARKSDIVCTSADVKTIMRYLETSHQQIQEFFYSDKGVELMYYESQMAEEIMFSLAADGIPCLPVHDSFVVPQYAEKQLEQAMIEAFKNRFGFSPTIKAKERVSETDLMVVNGRLSHR